MGNTSSQTLVDSRIQILDRSKVEVEVISNPMVKTSFIKISALNLSESQLPEVEQQEQIKQKTEGGNYSFEEVKVKWNSFIKKRQGNFLLQYEIVKQIGRGGFGFVYKVKGIYNGSIRAAKKIKKCDLDQRQKQRLFNEVAILQSLDHPNIVKLYQVYEQIDEYVLIMELCEGGELFKKIARKQLSKKAISKIMRQLLEVLVYIHSRQVIHRDIKPENILLDKQTGNIKIIDFGIAYRKVQANEMLSCRIGTAYYIAPEVLMKNYNEKCDVWAAGVVLYMMLFNRPPFAGDNENLILEAILKERVEYDGKKWSQLPFACKDLVAKLLKKKPSARPTALEAIMNPWLDPGDSIKITRQIISKSTEQMAYFGFRNRLQAVVYTYCISQLLKQQQKNGLEQIFKEVDTDFDGRISLEQFRDIMKDRIKDEDRLQSVMRLIDLDGSGTIEYTEFLVASLNPSELLNIEHYCKAFDYFDIDHSGGISFQEVAKFLEGNQSEQSIKMIFQMIDSNGDGNITREEFVALFLENANQNIKQRGLANKKRFTIQNKPDNRQRPQNLRGSLKSSKQK